MSAPADVPRLDAPVRAELDSGLKAAEKLKPGSGYLEATAGAAGDFKGGLAAFARAEAGWHPTENLSAFAFGEARSGEGWQAGVGARLTW